MKPKKSPPRQPIFEDATRRITPGKCRDCKGDTFIVADKSKGIELDICPSCCVKEIERTKS